MLHKCFAANVGDVNCYMVKKNNLTICHLAYLIVIVAVAGCIGQSQSKNTYKSQHETILADWIQYANTLYLLILTDDAIM